MLDKIKKETEVIKKEIRERILTFVGAAFGFVVGLAWNDAIKSLIEYIFPLGKGTLLIKFIYALAVTLLMAVVMVYAARFLKEEK